MLRTVEATLDPDGTLHLCEDLRLGRRYRVLVTLLDEPAEGESALLAEPALAEDWLRAEEDEAWADWQPDR